MTHIIGISGSTRRGSYNTALLRAAFEDLPDGVTAEIVTLNDIPFYSADDEQEFGGPRQVEALRARVDSADAIVFATPEYNNSVPAVLKNAIDWLSRGHDSPLAYLPTAIIGAGGGSGTRHAQRHLRDILASFSPRLLASPRVMVARAPRHFDEAGLADPKVRSDLRLMLERLAALAEEGAPLPLVEGSVLVAGSTSDTADQLAGQLGERGYRTLVAVNPTDAARMIESRSVAAVVIDSAVDRTDHDRIAEAMGRRHPGAPIIIADDSGVGDQVDGELRLLATR
jgi:chromate reductase